MLAAILAHQIRHHHTCVPQPKLACKYNNIADQTAERTYAGVSRES